MHLEADGVYRIYSNLSNDYPKGHKDLQVPTADWWQKWQDSRKVRNEIVHGKPARLQDKLRQQSMFHRRT